METTKTIPSPTHAADTSAEGLQSDKEPGADGIKAANVSKPNTLVDITNGSQSMCVSNLLYYAQTEHIY